MHYIIYVKIKENDGGFMELTIFEKEFIKSLDFYQIEDQDNIRTTLKINNTSALFLTMKFYDDFIEDTFLNIKKMKHDFNFDIYFDENIISNVAYIVIKNEDLSFIENLIISANYFNNEELEKQEKKKRRL